MSSLTRQQVEEMLKNKPQGVTDRAIIESLTKRGYQLEGLKLPSQVDKKPNTIERVSGAVTSAGEDIYNQLNAPNKNALVRGTDIAARAATAIPDVALQAIPEPLGGGLIRSGLEKVGTTLSKGFGKVTDYLSETPLIKGAAGSMQGNDYVPNDLGYLEDALKVASNIGQVSEVTAGAATAPGAVTRTATRTATALADVGREALDKTIRASESLANKATPKSVRTLLRLNTPENRTAAIGELTDAYMSGLVEGRKAINNKLDNLAALESIGGNTVTRDTLIRDLATEGYIPKIEGQFAKFDDVFNDISGRQRDIVQQIDNELAPLNGIEFETSLERMRADATAILQNSPNIGAGLTNSIREIDRMFQSFAQKYGPSLSPIEVNNVRKEMNRLTGAYKAKGGESIFEMDAADVVGKVARQRLDEVVPSGKVRQLNQEWARLERVSNTARILNNEIVEVGLLGRKLGSYVGTIGASLAGLSIAGPGGLVVASIFAQLGSDAIATLLRTGKFSPELRKVIINEIKKEPELAGRLIREASPENKAYIRNLLLGGASVGAVDYFLSDEDAGAAAAFLIGSTGGKTPITGKALDRVEEYLDWQAGVKKVTGQELIDLKADAQLIAEGAGVKATGGDKQLGNELRKALDKQNFSKKTESATTKTTDLLEEARKYKSADEFVKAQGTPVYHGTDKQFDSFELTEGIRSSALGNREVGSNAIFVTKDRKTADFFAKNRADASGEKPRVIETYLNTKKTADFTSVDSIESILDELNLDGKVEETITGLTPTGASFRQLVDMGDIEIEDLFNVIDNKEIVDALKNAGYDSVELVEPKRRGNSLAVFDPTAIKTRSQLEDIWEQANK